MIITLFKMLNRNSACNGRCGEVEQDQDFHGSLSIELFFIGSGDCVDAVCVSFAGTSNFFFAGPILYLCYFVQKMRNEENLHAIKSIATEVRMTRLFGIIAFVIFLLLSLVFFYSKYM